MEFWVLLSLRENECKTMKSLIYSICLLRWCGCFYLISCLISHNKILHQYFKLKFLTIFKHSKRWLFFFTSLLEFTTFSSCVCVCLEPIFVLQAKFHQMGKNKLNFLNKVILGLFVAKFWLKNTFATFIMMIHPSHHEKFGVGFLNLNL